MTTPLHHVFVYGTLMRGERNHRLLADAIFVGPARTAPHFTLHNFGPYPAIADGGHTAIEGEHFAVNDATLARLDRLEGHPDYYERTPIVLDDGRTMQAYVFRRELTCPVIPSGSWRARHQEELTP